MYNGNGGYKGGQTRLGGFRIKPVYLYVAGLVAVVIAIFFVMRFLNTSLVMHFGAFAGLLLLVANIRELIGISSSQRSSTALLNVMVGGGLIFAWLAQLFGLLFWIPAILLVGIATPLVVGRAAVYTNYITTARSAVDMVRRSVIR